VPQVAMPMSFGERYWNAAPRVGQHPAWPQMFM
jgi:hypothetical protein